MHESAFDKRAPSLVAALAGVVALGVAIPTLYPGWYSFDSAWQLLQARTGDYANLQPPLMAATWSLLLRAGLPPGSMLVMHLLLTVAGCVLLARSLSAWGRALAPLVLLWPPFLALFGHLWLDVSLAAALTFAGGLVAASTRHRLLARWALIPLTYAVGVRHNALPAVLPLLILALARGWQLDGWKRLLWAVTIAVGGLGASLLMANLLVAKPVPSWTSTAIWDLSAASAASGEVLLPEGMYGPGLDVAELAALTNPHTSMTLIVDSKSGINFGIAWPLPDAVRDELRRRWLCLPLTHPGAWLAHRAAVVRSLLGPQPRDKTESLFIVPEVVPLQDNPAMAVNASALNRWLLQVLREWRSSWWCAPVSYLALGMLGVFLCLRRRFAGDRGLVLGLSFSAWLYTLPLAVVVPSAEWRYALWPMLASMLALLLAIAAPSAAHFRRPSTLASTPTP